MPPPGDIMCDDSNVELLTENGADFKTAQNTFKIKWRRLPVAPGLQVLVDSLDIFTFTQQNLAP